MLKQPQNEALDIRREPKYAELVREISQQVRVGELEPGDQLPSFTELQKRWGVGRRTLERIYKALEQDGLITREHRRGVFVAHPQPLKKNGMVGFISSVRLLRHPYYIGLLNGVRRQAELSGMEVVLLSEETQIRWEKVDGVLCQASVYGNLEIPHGMPVISLVYVNGHLDSAVADDYVGMRQAMEHLQGLGHRRIAFLSNEMQPHTMSHQRLAAYQDAYRALNIVPQAQWMRTLSDPGAGIDCWAKNSKAWEQVGYEDMKRWLAEGWRDLGCTAILAHNDETAVGIIEALQEAGLRVPEDVSVVGFDGTEIAHFHRPRLTTVKAPLEEIGARGFEMLLQLINRPLVDVEEERLPYSLTVPTQLQVGQSTAGPKIYKGSETS